MKSILAIDNGPTGSYCYVTFPDNTIKVEMGKIPVVEKMDYTKIFKTYKMLDWAAMNDIIAADSPHVILERPGINPKFPTNTVIGAIRFHDSTIRWFEEESLDYEIIDSKQWQKVLMPKDIPPKDKKKAGKLQAERLYPMLTGQKSDGVFKGIDGDAFLIAYWHLRMRGEKE